MPLGYTQMSQTDADAALEVAKRRWEDAKAELAAAEAALTSAAKAAGVEDAVVESA